MVRAGATAADATEVRPCNCGVGGPDEKAVARRLNKAALDHVVYAPLGFFLQYQAWRKTVTGIVQGPLPFFWGVSKTV